MMATPQESWWIDEDRLTLHEKLGEGGQGAVYRAELQTRDVLREVAAKKLIIDDSIVHRENQGASSIPQHTELAFLQRLDHPNIVKFIGAVFTRENHLIIVTELAEIGSLRGYLARQPKNLPTEPIKYAVDHPLPESHCLPNRLFFRWALQASVAVQYIQQNRVVHRDIKSPNFVITSEENLKLCDFGIAKWALMTQSTDSRGGTIRWMAPENYTGAKAQVSPKSDIFSLGLVIWELISGKKPFEGSEDFNIMWIVGNENERPPIPESVSPRIKALLVRCWDADRTKRPDIGEVISIIHEEWLRNAGLNTRRESEYESVEIDDKVRDFHLAALVGDVETCKNALERGMDVECRSKFNVTPLHAGALGGQVKVCELLLLCKAEIEARDEDGFTPLLVAARTGQKKTCKLLLDTHAEVDPDTRGQFAPLYIAAYNGFDIVCKILIDAGANVHTIYKGATPLHEASFNGHATVCEVLLDAGSDIEAKAHPLGDTPLYGASQEGHVDVCKLLIARGANVNARTRPGKEATPLVIAAQYGQDNVCKVLIEAGAEINAVGSDEVDGATPLHAAAYHDHPDTCKVLLAEGADVNAKMKHSYVTPLHVASFKGHASVCEVLIEHGADIEAEMKDGETPLYLAAYIGHVDVCSQLLNAKANIEAKKLNKYTPLSAAADNKHDQVCSLLVEAGANPDVPIKGGGRYSRGLFENVRRGLQGFVQQRFGDQH